MTTKGRSDPPARHSKAVDIRNIAATLAWEEGGVFDVCIAKPKHAARAGQMRNRADFGRTRPYRAEQGRKATGN